MTVEEIRLLCRRSDALNGNVFRTIVSGYIKLPGTSSPDLALYCQVPEWTVARWASGASLPGHQVRRFVTNRIETLLVDLEPAPSPPQELMRLKNNTILQLQGIGTAESQEYIAAARLAARLEGEIAAHWLGIGDRKRAAANIASQASCLIMASDIIEAAELLVSVRELNPALMQGFESRFVLYSSDDDTYLTSPYFNTLTEWAPYGYPFITAHYTSLDGARQEAENWVDPVIKEVWIS
jgi:hypothetical protein